MAKHVVTDTIVVELTMIYEEDEEPTNESFMDAKDYETLFKHLNEISAGELDSFDDAHVKSLKHFVSEEQ